MTFGMVRVMSTSPGLRAGWYLHVIQGGFSHYDVKEALGVGGMGEVYRAHDRRLGRDVALKILPASFAAVPERRGRFLREARLAAGISHPNVATIFEADEIDGQLYYAMELIEGETLEARVRAGGMAPAELLKLAIPLTEGLAEAHKKGPPDILVGSATAPLRAQEPSRTRRTNREMGRTGRPEEEPRRQKTGPQTNRVPVAYGARPTRGSQGWRSTTS